MANPATRKSIRDRAKRRADQENQSFISNAEWNDYIDEGLSELYDIIVSRYEDYIVSDVDITLVPGQDAYTLPTDFYKTIGVDFLQGSALGPDAVRYRLTRYAFRERNIYRETYLHSGLSLVGPYYEYRIEGNSLKLIPTPGEGVVKLWYYPQAPVFTNDTTAINLVFVQGWEEFIVLSAAIKAMAKEESDPAVLIMQKDELKNRIITMASDRDVGEPNRVTDVYETSYWATRQRRYRWGV
jgi:hypothetical protein